MVPKPISMEVADQIALKYLAEISWVHLPTLS